MIGLKLRRSSSRGSRCFAPSTKRASHRTRPPLAQRGTVSLERPSTSWKRSSYARSMRALCGKDQALSCICRGKESGLRLCWFVCTCVVGLTGLLSGAPGAQLSGLRTSNETTLAVLAVSKKSMAECPAMNPSSQMVTIGRPRAMYRHSHSCRKRVFACCNLGAKIHHCPCTP